MKKQIITVRRVPDNPHETMGAASGVKYLDPRTTPIQTAKNTALLPGVHIFDAFGDLWVVADSRASNHGFEIYFGRPKEATGPMGAATIITAELAGHFEKHRRTPKNLELPISKNTVTRIRSVLGHHRYQDAEIWWLDRINDLAQLTIADFAARHRVSAGAISEARTALIGPHQRPANWWRTPEMTALLHSKMPTAWIAQQMGLSAVAVRKYRVQKD